MKEEIALLSKKVDSHHFKLATLEQQNRDNEKEAAEMWKQIKGTQNALQNMRIVQSYNEGLIKGVMWLGGGSLFASFIVGLFVYLTRGIQ